jgi:hypothetical protein
LPHTGRFCSTIGRSGRLVDGAVPPPDARGILHRRQEWQRHLAVEQRIADRILRGADVDPPRRQDGRLLGAIDAGDDHLGVPFRAPRLDLLPVLLGGPPRGRIHRFAEHLAAGVVAHDDVPAVDGAGGVVLPEEGRRDDLRVGTACRPADT